MTTSTNPVRCDWCGSDPLYQQYHDQEWGVPCFDDRRLFEFLILEGAQAGLAWITVLRKREGYREAFDDFDPERIARYDQSRINALRENSAIIRNRLKIESAIRNAQAYLDILDTCPSFSDFIWQFVDGQPLQNQWQTLLQVPAVTSQAEVMSKALKKAGFNFVGPTICYAYMQAVGMVNDHLVSCYRHHDCAELAARL